MLRCQLHRQCKALDAPELSPKNLTPTKILIICPEHLTKQIQQVIGQEEKEKLRKGKPQNMRVSLGLCVESRSC